MFCLIIERISLQLDHLLLLLFRGQAECVVRWCWLEPQVLPLIKVTSLLVSAEPPRASLAAETKLGFSSSSCILVSSRMCALLLAVLPIFFLLPNSCLLFLCCPPSFYFLHAVFNFLLKCLDIWWNDRQLQSLISVNYPVITVATDFETPRHIFPWQKPQFVDVT